MKSKILAVLLISLIMVADSCRDTAIEEVPTCCGHTFPLNLTAVPDGKTINLQWLSNANAESYDIYIGVGTQDPVLVAEDVLQTTYSYDVPPGAGVNYTWYVTPRDSDGKEIVCQPNTTSFVAQELPALETQQKTVNVLVVNYDPIVKYNAEEGTALHAIYGWFDPHVLAEGYMSDVLISSHGLIKYNIVDWRDVREYPAKKDGFIYNDFTYLDCMFGGNKKEKCHAPDDLDYYKMIQDHDIVNGINNDEYEEVWIFGAPYFGFWESCMAGPGAFAINGDIYTQVATKKAFAIMGFSYERGVSEMMHNLCHRTEATMSETYGGWRAEVLTTSWAKFAANQQQSGTAAVGTCHYPPNATKDYDYANARIVKSSADDWYNYPLLTNTKTDVNFVTWVAWNNGPEIQENYLNWWFDHLPRRTGVAPDGKLNNWWKYLFDFNETVIKK